ARPQPDRPAAATDAASLPSCRLPRRHYARRPGARGSRSQKLPGLVTIWQGGPSQNKPTDGECRKLGGAMRPKLFAAALAAALFAWRGSAAADPIELQWWHAMTAVNGERVNKLAADFNASQSDYKIVPVFKGSYAETMTAAIAAYRSGNAPHIVQVFEVGTAT